MKVMLNTNNFNNVQNRQTMQRPVFKGAYSSFTDKLAQGLANVLKKEKAADFIDYMAKKDVVSTLAASTGIVISGFYMYNTAKSKKIEQDQKRPLIINMGLVTGISTILGLFINSKTNKKMEQLEKYFEKNAKIANNDTLKICTKGIRPATKLLTFVAIYRYLAPVLITPVANKISNVLSNRETPKKA